MLTYENVHRVCGGRDDHSEDDESCADDCNPTSTHEIRQRSNERTNSGESEQICKDLGGVSDDLENGNFSCQDVQTKSIDQRLRCRGRCTAEYRLDKISAGPRCSSNAMLWVWDEGME